MLRVLFPQLKTILIAQAGDNLPPKRVRTGKNDMIFWAADVDVAPDQYAAFRGEFELAEQAQVEIALFGLSWFVVWLDGGYLTEGPARYEHGHPQYEVRELTLPAGKHVLAVQAHYIGVDTRILENAPPFLSCNVSARGSPVEVAWKGVPLDGYVSQVRRINPQLGWIAWCDTRKKPAGWRARQFEDSEWPAVSEVEPEVGEATALDLAPMKRVVHELEAIAAGPLANAFGYAQDDPPARFFLRDLEGELPQQGVWRRYDLGRVRLGKPRFTLDVPAGAVIEFAYAESLSHDRVAPYINLSAGASANMDHYAARGGVQTFEPLTPKGGRYLDVHVLANPEQIAFEEEVFIEREYFGEARGAFACSDPQLDRIWQVGIDTLRACAEDALTDNPTRERGQWTGDVVGVGMDIAAAAYDDLRLLRRGLVQSAQAARDDGLVAGMAPGGSVYLASYAAQWVTACMHYYRLTGDKALLEELWEAAAANVAALERDPEEPGVPKDVAWNFIDWGYDPPDTELDPALNLHFLDTLEAMTAWARRLEKEEDAQTYTQRADSLRATLAEHIGAARAEAGFTALGYHATALALGRGFFEGDDAQAAEGYVKRHILACFPNDPRAPRLSDPQVQSNQLITPYFAHYAFPVLIERGGMDFVLDQYRTCWGWMLDTGATTWLEVFDTRWSHCHQWAGCPTWQLTRYALGLHPRFDRGANHFDFQLVPGSLEWAKGTLPLPDDASVHIEWVQADDAIQYTLTPDVPLHLTGLPGDTEPRIISEPATITLGQ